MDSFPYSVQADSVVNASVLKKQSDPLLNIGKSESSCNTSRVNSPKKAMGLCTDGTDQQRNGELCGLVIERERLNAERERLGRDREAVRREKQVLRCAKELLRAERQSLDAEKEVLQAAKEALAAEKEIIKAQKQLLKSERDAMKAEKLTLEAERRSIDVERMTVKAQIAVLKAERYELELERQSVLACTRSEQRQGSADVSDGANDEVAEDSGNEEAMMPDLRVQFGDASTSSMFDYQGDGDADNFGEEKLDFYQCEVCSKMYRSHKSFARHLKIHTASFHCGTCQKPFHSQDELEEHKQEHARTKLICPVCGDALVSKYSLEKHRRMKHAKEELLACTYPGCIKRFFNEQLLSDHMNVHAHRKPYHCLKCGRQYASALALIAHKKGCGNPDAHVCDVCGVRMSARSTLAEHKRRRHTEERYICPCGQQYAWRSGIIRHKKKCMAAVAD